MVHTPGECGPDIGILGIETGEPRLLLSADQSRKGIFSQGKKIARVCLGNGRALIVFRP
jgi:hypothetical protein